MTFITNFARVGSSSVYRCQRDPSYELFTRQSCFQSLHQTTVVPKISPYSEGMFAEHPLGGPLFGRESAPYTKCQKHGNIFQFQNSSQHPSTAFQLGQLAHMGSCYKWLVGGPATNICLCSRVVGIYSGCIAHLKNWLWYSGSSLRTRSLSITFYHFFGCVYGMYVM